MRTDKNWTNNGGLYRTARLCLLTSVGFTTSLSAHSSWAQGSQRHDLETLESVIVTAQRRTEQLEDVPISITNLSAEQLTRAGVRNLAEISALTPALRFDNNGSFVQPTIRGIGTPLAIVGSGSNVGVYIDGFYSPNPQGVNSQLLNVESIQVLKGPQGTLFGRNTSGGAILVTTREPAADFSAIGEIYYGSYNAQNYEGYITTGVTDTIAVDLGATRSRGDGFIRNIFTEDDEAARYDNWSVRTGLKFEPSDSVSVLLRYMREEKDDRTSVSGNAFVVDGQPAVLGAFIPGAVVTTRPGQVSDDVPTTFWYQADIFQLTASLELGFPATLRSYSQYRKEDVLQISSNDYVSLPLLQIRLPVEDETITQEFLLTSHSGGRLQWTAGVFFFDNRNAFPHTEAQVFGGPYAFSSDVETNTRSLAAYADATYALRDDLYLTGGARYTRDEVDYSFVLANLQRTDAETATNSRVTPRVVIRYEPSPRSSVYASFSRGYKGAIYGGFNIPPVPVNPESLSAYEVGYKYAARGLTADLSTFYYDYTDQQLTNSVTINGTPQTQIRNAASSSIYGIEGQASYRFTDDFEVTAGAVWNHARFDDFPNSPGFAQCTDADVCGSNLGMLLATTVDASGYSMSRSPDFTSSVAARYTTPVANGELMLSGNLYYTSKFYFDTSEQFSQDAYTLLNLRAQWTSPSGRYAIAVYGNNVTDEEYMTQWRGSTFGAGAFWGAPATVGASVRISL